MMIKLDSSVASRLSGAMLISTQCMENYAWREDGSLNTDSPRWKAKGGNEVLVTGLDAELSLYEQVLVLDAVREQIETDNDSFHEFIVATRMVAANYDPAEGVTDDVQYAAHLRSSLMRIVNPRG